MGALLLITSLLVVIGPTGEAQACSCAMVDPATMLEDADAAFVGTLTERPTEPNPGDGFNGVYVFEVEEWVKGDLGSQVGVHSALDGAACGFELQVGESAGVFIHNDNGRPSGGLCSTTSADALLSANRPLVFDGSGPPVFLISAPTGRTRLATLDASGRLLAAEGDDRTGWSVSVCPGSELLVDVVEGEVTVRQVVSLDVLRVEDPPVEGRVEQAWCLDDSADRILTQVWPESGAAPSLRILGEDEPVHQGQSYILDVGGDHVALVAEPTSSSVELIDLSSKEVRPLAGAAEMNHVSFSPDGAHLLIVHTDHGSSGGWTSQLIVYDVDNAEATWTSGAQADLEVYGWVDDTRMAGGIYPVEADEPQTVVFDIDADSFTEVDIPGWNLAAVGESLVSESEGRLVAMTGDGEVSPLASFPTPAHRLVTVLDESATLTVPDPPPTTGPPTTEPTQSAPPEAAPAGSSEGSAPVAIALVGGALVVVLGGLILYRRRV